MATTATTFACAKCRHTECETDEGRVTGGTFAKFADVENKNLTTVSCKQCGHTELYKEETSISATSSISSPAVEAVLTGQASDSETENGVV